MSSPPKDGSLLGLLRTAKYVIGCMGYPREIFQRWLFEEVQQEINWLQTTCPNHPGVLEARVWWYELALERFESRVVVPTEQMKDWPFMDDGALYVPDDGDQRILAGTHVLEHFLRRSYLKDSFPRLYTRLLSLYVRLSQVQRQGEDGPRIRKAFAEKSADLQDRLLRGMM